MSHQLRDDSLRQVLDKTNKLDSIALINSRMLSNTMNLKARDEDVGHGMYDTMNAARILTSRSSLSNRQAVKERLVEPH